MSIIRFEGKLVQTTKKSITEECFNDLIANGRESSFYPFIRQISSDDIIQNGFELTDKKVSSVEGFHDDESLDLTETLHKDYQVQAHVRGPASGASRRDCRDVLKPEV